MNRQKLFSEINYAMNSIAYDEQEIKEWKKALKKVKEDLEKLNQYKQLEKQLGINLELYVNTYLKGVYVKGMEPLWSGGQENEICHYAVVSFTKGYLEVCYATSHDTHYLWKPLEEYGKTWALTKEELENA